MLREKLHYKLKAGFRGRNWGRREGGGDREGNTLPHILAGCV
jgi:hypothetical protein